MRDVFEDQTPDGPNHGTEQFSGPFKQPPCGEKITSWELTSPPKKVFFFSDDSPPEVWVVSFPSSFFSFSFASSSSSSSFATPTAMMCAQCSLPDLNRDPVSSVFLAGPQPRSCEFSVPCRTSTAIL